MGRMVSVWIDSNTNNRIRASLEIMKHAAELNDDGVNEAAAIKQFVYIRDKSEIFGLVRKYFSRSYKILLNI